MARPTKYSEEVLEKAKKYANGDYTSQGEVLPTVQGLALYLDLNVRTLQDWATQPEKAEFSRTLDGLKNKQATFLISKGLEGEYNPALAKLMLHNHGYSDKIEQIQEVKITISDEELDAELDRLSED